tara:strand:- start:638 stop:808 length:171 start_codon:yes stop_codon:yes gene_type:complete
MTQHSNKIQKRKEEIAKEKLNETVVSYEYQRGADLHFRKITYASGKEVTIDLSNKN